MALGIRLRRQLHDRFEIWLRLRRWVRWLCGTLLVLLLALTALWVLNRRPPAPLPAVSVKLAGPPAASADAQPVDPNMLAVLLTNRIPLQPAPFDKLTVATANGMLPRKATNDQGGETTPLQAYAAAMPALPPTAKRLAIIVIELGLSDRATEPALALPAPVTLAYDAMATNLADQINAARAAGHEIVLDIPMEPRTYPLDDPGPETLLTNMPAKQALRQLHALLARAPGAIALLSRSGDYFTTQSTPLWPLLQDLSLRGLGWVDLGTAKDDLSMAVAAKVGLPAARATLTLDEQPGETAVRAQFESALATLDKTGQALLVVHSYPNSLAVLTTLLQTLPGRGIALVPASNLLKLAPQ